MLLANLPFSITALQSAVRSYLAQPSARVGDVAPRRMVGGFSGSPVYKLKVSYYLDDLHPRQLHLIYKEGLPLGTYHLPGIAERETGFYRTLAPLLPVRTPRMLLSAQDAGEGAAAGGGNWVLLEALPQERVWPQARWREEDYRHAIEALADLHALCWDHPPDPQRYPWVWRPTLEDAPDLAAEAHRALRDIEGAPWAAELFPCGALKLWLRAVDDPAPLLAPLNALPHTLIHGDYWPGNIALRPPEPGRAHPAEGPAIFDWQFAGVGPAPYDLSCLHALSRWWFGPLPLTLAAMRDLYLERLLTHGIAVERALFDLSLDAARAWRFATFWPRAIEEQSAYLLARKHFFRTGVLEPALASLRRVTLSC